MNNNTNDFDKIENAAAEKRQAQDISDLNDERAGNLTGRIARFLSPELRAELIAKRNGTHSTAMSALEYMLLNNAAYAEIYSNTMDALETAEQATARALSKATAYGETTKTTLADTLEQAAQLPNGTRVFSDEQNRVWTQDDILVEEDQADKIEWRGNEPSRETFHAQRKVAQKAQNSITEILTYQTDVLGRIRGEMNNSDKPPISEDMERFQAEIEKGQPELVQKEIGQFNTIGQMETTANMGIPKLD